MTETIGTQKAAPNYFTYALLSTIFLFLPFGVVALYYVSQVDTFNRLANYTAAFEASKKVKIWCWAAFGIWIFFFAVVAFMIAMALVLPGIVGKN